MNSDTIEDISDLEIFDSLELNKAEVSRALDISRQTLHNRLHRKNSSLSPEDWAIIARHFQTRDSKIWDKLVSLLERLGKTGSTALRVKVPSGIPGITLAELSPGKIAAVIPDFDLFRTVEHDCFEQLANEVANGTAVDIYVHGEDSANDFARSLVGWKGITEESISQSVNINFFAEPGPCPFVFQVKPKGSLQVIYLTAMLNQFVQAEQVQYASIFSAATRSSDEFSQGIAV